MKKLTILSLALLFGAAPIASHAQTPPPPSDAVPPAGVTAADVVATVKAAPNAASRKELVEQAIRDNPDIAANLIALLIAEFPAEAADYTATVVTAVIALPDTARNTEQKAAILTTVAQAAVPAALLIPASRVDSVVQAVNAVKDALATVTSAANNAEFANAVGAFTAPLIEGQELILATPEGQETVIVSGDSLVSS